jgi:hypothetical protein
MGVEMKCESGSKQYLSQVAILDGLKNHIQFYPDPTSAQFRKLSPMVQEKARLYWENEQDRVDRLLQGHEQGDW